MTDMEQLEAWIEKRMIERRATRQEVRALRRYRRSPDSPGARVGLVGAVMNAMMAPLVPVMVRFTETLVQAAAKMNALWLKLAISQMEQADLGEFDNRARDWLQREPSTSDEE